MSSSIQNIYEHYTIPKNLQRHMYRVAAVGAYIIDYWQSDIDEHSIMTALLLHDMGNILKFDFSRGVELFDPEERDIEHWLAVQAEYRAQYGDDVHDATLAIARAVGASQRVQDLIAGMGSTHIPDVVESNDWEQKICIYCDFRVDPHGFVSVEERFADIIDRYAGRNHPLANQESTMRNRDQCLQIEAQLNEQVPVDLRSLPRAELEQKQEQLRTFVISEE